MTFPKTPGWYTCPGDAPGLQRWFDGYAWTDRMSGVPATSPTRTSPNSAPRQQTAARTLGGGGGGWRTRAGDPPGVTRWHDGSRWTNKLSGDAAAIAQAVVLPESGELTDGRTVGQVPAGARAAPSLYRTEWPEVSRGKVARNLAWRYFNAACYLISGVVMIILEVKDPSDGGATFSIVAAIMIAYGLYVGLTRGSYWVSTATYLIPVLGIVFAAVSASAH